MVTVALDTNVIVALVDDRDTWRATALAIRDTLIEAQAQLIYFNTDVDRIPWLTRLHDAALQHLPEIIPLENRLEVFS
jgi:predicted nucleic acid-binding protein